MLWLVRDLLVTRTGEWVNSGSLLVRCRSRCMRLVCRLVLATEVMKVVCEYGLRLSVDLSSWCILC